MTDVIGTFRVGEDATIALDAVTGDVSIVTGATAYMRRMGRAGSRIDLTITPRPAGGGFPAGWNITAPGSLTADLPLGRYAVDARLTGAGFTEITDESAVIEFVQ